MPDWQQAWAGGEKACELGLADACAWMGWNGDNGGMNKGVDARAGYYARACDLGKWESCKEAAEIWLEGKWNAKRRTGEAVKILDTWCDSGKYDACWALAGGYKEGKPYGDPTEMRPDPKKFEAVRKKACATKDPRRLEKPFECR
jgi:TPR repeat protein